MSELRGESAVSGAGLPGAARESMNRKYDELLALPLDRGKVLVLTHDNPDPDSIASAAALGYLLREKRGIDCTVAYSGIIGRAENRALVEHLDLAICHLDDLNADDYAHLALVDAQPGTGNSALTIEHDVDIVIDHHPLRDATRNARFYDVREGIGASATIVTQYLRAAGLELPHDLAAALLYGIRSETQDLGREVSEDDREAYEFLFPQVDPRTLGAIINPKLERRYFRQLTSAFDSMLVGEEVAICPMGEVSDPDFVPEMADVIIRMKGILWSLAYGTYKDHVYVSIRADDPDAAAGDIMLEVLDQIGKGGGHGMRAGGNIPLDELKLTRGELEAELRHRFLTAIGSPSASLDLLKTIKFDELDRDNGDRDAIESPEPE